MLDAATLAEIRRLFYAEHWKKGTIAVQLGVHPDAVGRALLRPVGPPAPRKPRPRITDPYLPFLQETLERYPRLQATVLYRMVRERGFTGSAVQLRYRVSNRWLLESESGTLSGAGGDILYIYEH